MLLELIEKLPDPVWQWLLRVMDVTEEAIHDLFHGPEDE